MNEPTDIEVPWEEYRHREIEEMFSELVVVDERELLDDSGFHIEARGTWGETRWHTLSASHKRTARRRYAASEKGKQARKKYAASPKGKAAQARYLEKRKALQ